MCAWLLAPEVAPCHLRNAICIAAQPLSPAPCFPHRLPFPVCLALYACFPSRFYSSEEELHRVFKSVNGLIFPGGLTDLWMDSPYVVAARKLWQWSKDANDNGERRPRLSGTACGRQPGSDLFGLAEAPAGWFTCRV